MEAERLIHSDEKHADAREGPPRWTYADRDLARTRSLAERCKTTAILVLLVLTLLSSSLAAALSWQTCARQSPLQAAVSAAFHPNLTFITHALSFKAQQPHADAWKDETYNGAPSRDSDLAWRHLQTVRGVWIDPDEAAALNITSGLAAGPPGGKATLLGVMHNLHCLRILRQLIHSDHYYPNDTAATHNARVVHSGHCLEALRQSLMCHPDLTPRSVYWENAERENVAVNPSARQQCVDWQSLVAWERGRAWDLEDIWAANPAA